MLHSGATTAGRALRRDQAQSLTGADGYDEATLRYLTIDWCSLNLSDSGCSRAGSGLRALVTSRNLMSSAGTCGCDRPHKTNGRWAK